MKTPFLELAPTYLELKADIDAAIGKTDANSEDGKKERAKLEKSLQDAWNDGLTDIQKNNDKIASEVKAERQKLRSDRQALLAPVRVDRTQLKADLEAARQAKVDKSELLRQIAMQHKGPV